MTYLSSELGYFLTEKAELIIRIFKSTQHEVSNFHTSICAHMDLYEGHKE